MKFEPKQSIVLLLATCLVLVPAVGHGQDQAMEQTSIALPAAALTFSTTYLAHDLGFFRKEGLDVTLVDITGAGGRDAAASGTVDFTVTTGSTFARTAGHGHRLLAIAGLLNRPMMELVLRTSLPTALDYDPEAAIQQRARLLRGRTIAVDALATNQRAYVQLVARKAGLDPEKDLRITPLPTAGMAAALATAKIDGFSSSPPWTTGPVTQGSALMLASSPRGDLSELLPFAYSLLVTRPEVCQQRRSVCEKIVRAYVAAGRVVRLNKSWALDNLKRRFRQVPDPVLDDALDTIRSATPRLPIVSVIGLENSELFNVSSGMVEVADTLRAYDDLYTNDFLR
jgi:ABC-type nitrate/sulfonate/bicarbonate transport system substrate-binding protein